jgi:hypothetical protein
MRTTRSSSNTPSASPSRLNTSAPSNPSFYSRNNSNLNSPNRGQSPSPNQTPSGDRNNNNEARNRAQRLPYSNNNSFRDASRRGNGGGGGDGRTRLPTEWSNGQDSSGRSSPAEANRREGSGTSEGYASLLEKNVAEDEVIPTAVVIKNVPFQVSHF